MTFLPYQILEEYKRDPENKYLTFDYNGKSLRLVSVSDTDEIVELLADWRGKFYDAFPSRFKITLDGTRNWLQGQVLGNEDRFLFLVKDGDVIIGHLGFFRFNKEENSCEIDNVVKGGEGYPGLMTYALQRVIGFAFDELRLSALTLRVFADNERAIKLYERCSFKHGIKIPLIREGNDEEYSWKEIDSADKAERFFLQMYFDK